MPRRFSDSLRGNLLPICHNKPVSTTLANATRAMRRTSTAARVLRPASGSAERWLLIPAAALMTLSAASAAFAADLTPVEAPVTSEPSAYDWTGLYLGGHIGYAWGNSDWSASTAAGRPLASGSLSLAQPLDNFNESGSFLAGLQTGYNFMLPNRVVLGVEADASFPPFPNPNTGLGIGGTSALLGRTESYSENVLASDTLRARLGYAPGSWFFYATGGIAWAIDDRMLTQVASGNSETQNSARFGWAAGAGAEAPVAPHWTARLEYLFKDYGSSSVTFPIEAQRFSSDLSMQEVRFGLSYQLGGEEPASEKDPAAPAKPGLGLHKFSRPDNFHLARISCNPVAL